MKTKILTAIAALALTASHASAAVLGSFSADFGGGVTATIEVLREDVGDGLDAIIINGTMDQPGNMFNTIGVEATPEAGAFFNQEPSFAPNTLPAIATPFKANAVQFAPLFGQNADQDTNIGFLQDILDPGGQQDLNNIFVAQAAVQPTGAFEAGEIARLVVPTGAEVQVDVLALGFFGTGGDNLIGLDGSLGFNTADLGGGGEPEAGAAASGPNVTGSSYDENTNTLSIDVVDDNGLFVDSFFDIFVENFGVDSFFDVFVELNVTRDFAGTAPANGIQLGVDGGTIDGPSSARFGTNDIFSTDTNVHLYADNPAGHLGDGQTETISFLLSGDLTDGAGGASFAFTLVPTPAAFLPGLMMLGMAATRRRR